MSNDALMNASEQSLNKERLQEMLPKGTSHKVTDEVISLISRMEEDTGLFQDYLEESLLSYLPVLKDVKVDLPDYVNAIKYCNLKRNMSNEKAWEITFPVKYKKLKDEGRINSSHSSMYNGSKLVVKLDAQMMVSTHIQYAPMFHKSLMKQYELMNGQAADGMPVSAQVQHLAAKTLAELTMQPIEQKVELEIGLSDEAKSVQEQLTEQIRKATDMQLHRLSSGEKISTVQRLGISLESKDVIDVEPEGSNG